MSSPDWFTELVWFIAHAKIWQHHRLLGRFESWASFTRWWRRGHRQGRRPHWVLPTTVVASAPAHDVAGSLRDDGYHAGLQLPQGLVDALHRHARETPCRRGAGDPERFLIGQIRDGRSPLGRPVAIADVCALETCPAAIQLAGDRGLFEMAEAHLGYSPHQVMTRLYWSPASALSDDERRRNGQTIDYHYDIERGRALYAYFHLTDVDRRSGAHVIVARSHKRKPLGMKLASTRRSEPAVLGYYGADKVVVMEGAAGSGFLEDPPCFHKVLPPTRSDRLVLQLRYI